MKKKKIQFKIVSLLFLFFMFTCSIYTGSCSFRKESLMKRSWDSISLEKDAEKTKDLVGSGNVGSSSSFNRGINVDKDFRRLEGKSKRKIQDIEDVGKKLRKTYSQNKELETNSSEDPQYPKITGTKNIAEADGLTYKEATVSEGEVVSTWEYVERKKELDAIDIFSRFEILNVEDTVFYVTLSIKKGPVHDVWILDTLSREELKGEESENGLTGSTEVTSYKINHSLPSGQPLNCKTTASGKVVYIPLEKLDELLFHWNQEGLIVNSRLASIVTGFKLSEQLKNLNNPILGHQTYASKAETVEARSIFLERFPDFLPYFKKPKDQNSPAMQGGSDLKADATSPEMGSIETEKTQEESEIGENNSEKNEVIVVQQGKRIALKKGIRTYNDGRRKVTPFVERKRNDQVGVDSVSGVVIQNIEGQEAYILLLAIFRPPHGDFILEAPAVSRNKDEEPVIAFERLLSQEIGETNQGSGGIFRSGIQAKEPSISSATAQTFLGTNYLKAGQTPKETRHDEHENIITIKVPAKNFAEFISGWNEIQLRVDSGLGHMGAGVRINEFLRSLDSKKDTALEKKDVNEEVSTVGILRQVAEENEKLREFLTSRGKI